MRRESWLGAGHQWSVGTMAALHYFHWGNRIGAQLEKSGLLAPCSKYGAHGTLGVF